MDDHQNLKPGKTYINPALVPFAGTRDQKPEERVQIASKVIGTRAS